MKWKSADFARMADAALPSVMRAELIDQKQAEQPPERDVVSVQSIQHRFNLKPSPLPKKFPFSIQRWSDDLLTVQAEPMSVISHALFGDVLLVNSLLDALQLSSSYEAEKKRCPFRVITYDGFDLQDGVARRWSLADGISKDDGMLCMYVCVCMCMCMNVCVYVCVCVVCFKRFECRFGLNVLTLDFVLKMKKLRQWI